MSEHKCMQCAHGSVCDDFEGSHAKNCEFFEPENKWISVKDRLPENLESYLVVIKEKDHFEDKWNYAVDVATSHGSYIDGFWDTYNDWCEGQEIHVTCWMPLPEPPEDKEKEGL